MPKPVPKPTHKTATRLVTAGRGDHTKFGGLVNPPVYKGSTVLFKNLAELEEATARPFGRTFYGRMGTPTVFCFEEAVASLYNGGNAKAVAVSSGLAAIVIAISAFVNSPQNKTSNPKATPKNTAKNNPPKKDKILVADNVYAPTRKFCQSLAHLEKVYFDPTLPIDPLLCPRTALVFLESPGSLTMEVQDTKAITAACAAQGIPTVMDNTWATALYFDPFASGVDVVVEAATKYITGHADAMLGVIVCRSKHYKLLKTTATIFGNSAGTDECYLGQRGLRTMHLRLACHQQNAIVLAKWLAKNPMVKRVLHPTFKDCPGHRHFKSDFCGSSGLFSVELVERPKRAWAKMLNQLKLFGLGYSWGGYESLMLPAEPVRGAMPDAPKKVLRIHAGLEDPADLLADLEAALTRYKKAA